MGFIYSSLNKCDSESWSQFDNRIARMLPFVTGIVYFDLRNYDSRTGEFGVYAEWDQELENVLGYALPCGGYFVKATISQAYRFHGLGCGLPVYTKLISHGGRLYPYRTYVMMDGRPFSLEFGGGELIPIDDRYVELGCAAAEEKLVEVVSAKSSDNQGRFRHLTGSQYGFRHLTGSQRFVWSGSQRFTWNGSRLRTLFGSQRGFRYLMGSQYGFRHLTGSQRFVWSGSQRFTWNGSRLRTLFGSQRGFRYLTGSQYGFRHMTGSQRFAWNSSQRFAWSGSQRPTVVQGNASSQLKNRTDSTRVSQDLLLEFPQEWQLINKCRRPEKRIGGNARFGYGLDLI